MTNMLSYLEGDYHGWTCWLNQQLLITVYLPRKTSVHFPFPIAADKQSLLFCFPLTENKLKLQFSVCGLSETWRHGHGDMETWKHGNMETWRNGDGDIETWRHWHRDFGTCRNGGMETSGGNQKTEALGIFLYPFTVCASRKRKFDICPFVDEESKQNLPICKRVERTKLTEQTKRTCQSMEITQKYLQI